MAKNAKVAKPVLYRHSSHAEWGLGMIVKENPNKVYLAFEDGGRRPFVNAPRYRELLVPAVLAAEDVDALVAKLGKSEAKLSAKAEKKPKKKAVVEEEEAAAPAGEEEEREED